MGLDPDGDSKNHIHESNQMKPKYSSHLRDESGFWELKSKSQNKDAEQEARSKKQLVTCCQWAKNFVVSKNEMIREQLVKGPMGYPSVS